MIFKGCATALITPFNETGIDFDAFGRQIDYQIENGVSALVVCGTTGEPSTMPQTEKDSAIRFVVEHTKKRVPVIAGTGTNCTSETVKNSLVAESMGADAIMLVTPYYNRCNKRGLLAHFGEVDKASKLPIMIYNVPSRTCVDIIPSFYPELLKMKRIVAIKEACGDNKQIREISKIIKGKMTLYSGDDGNALSVLEMGGAGVVSVLSNIAPSVVSRICELFFAGEIAEAKKLHTEHKALIKLLFADISPIPVKTAVNLQNRNGGLLRLPLLEMEAEDTALLKTEMQRMGLV
jgi:4-hydroxy-tetrahydrodipicolinate synthase